MTLGYVCDVCFLTSQLVDQMEKLYFFYQIPRFMKLHTTSKENHTQRSIARFSKLLIEMRREQITFGNVHRNAFISFVPSGTEKYFCMLSSVLKIKFLMEF